MKKEIIIEKGKYFLADVCDVRDAKPILLIGGDDGEYTLWDCVKKQDVDFVWKDSNIGVYAAEKIGGDFEVFELKESAEVSVSGGGVSFGDKFLLIDERGRSLLARVERCEEAHANIN